jgi:hypothetical protein
VTTALALVVLLAAPAQIDAPLSDEGGRFRFGASAQGGVQTLSGAFVIDVDLRAGAQLTQWASIYATVKAHVALASLSCGVLGVAVEGMLTNHLALAVAAMLAYGSFYGTELNPFTGFPTNYTEVGGSGLKPGFDVKLALSTGKSRPPTFNRAGMSIGLELLGLLVTEPMIVVPGRPVAAPPLWLFSPMLSLGVDFR